MAPVCEMSASSGNWYALIVTIEAGIETGARAARICEPLLFMRDANAFIVSPSSGHELTAPGHGRMLLHRRYIRRKVKVCLQPTEMYRSTVGRGTHRQRIVVSGGVDSHK